MSSFPSYPPQPANAALVLADGTVFWGYGIGATGETSGEICFNTGMTGYQEVFTDPSYAGQIITFTFPHIGNVGVNPEDIESNYPSVRGLIVREVITKPSNFRANGHLDDWLKQHKITGICGIDTRALTRHIRLNGAQNATIFHAAKGEKIDISRLKHVARACPSLDGLELALSVTAESTYEWNQTAWKLESGYGRLGKHKYHVVAIDFGEKLNILRRLAERGCKVTAVRADTSAEQILSMNPDGIFLSNGPGDPAATGQYAIETLKALMYEGVPIFGICLGHQLLALAQGAKTKKMHQGHRGANHPVKNLLTGKVEITSQNHGFVVDRDSLPANLMETHVSLFDGTNEGLKSTDKHVFSVQYHPESSPGPHDSQYLFDQFVEMMKDAAMTRQSQARKENV